MDTVSLADAKAQLSKLVDAAEGGATVEITRRGKVVARLVPAFTPRKPVDVAMLKAISSSMPYSDEDAGTFVRRMRDEDRY